MQGQLFSTRMPKKFNGEKNSLWYWNWKCFGSPCLPPYAKINSKWITDLNIRAKIASLIGENIGVNLCDLWLSKAFVNMKPKTQATEEKTGKLEFIKIKNPCAKGTIIQVKRQLHRKKKLFAKSYIWQEAYTYIIKKLLQCHNK